MLQFNDSVAPGADNGCCIAVFPAASGDAARDADKMAPCLLDESPEILDLYHLRWQWFLSHLAVF